MTNPLQPATSPAPALESVGLCKACSTPHAAPDVHLGVLRDGDHEYEVHPVHEQAPDNTTKSLAVVLEGGSSLRLNRVQRYSVAVKLASSHLKLHSTPWWKSNWTSGDILIPQKANNGNGDWYGEPYINLPLIASSSNPSVPKRDQSFAALGVVLLELCFGNRLETHHLWRDPSYATRELDPVVRQMVALDWLGDVQGEAGEQYAKAVSWTLQQAPAVSTNDKWRAEFAQNVVQPLVWSHEQLSPKT